MTTNSVKSTSFELKRLFCALRQPGFCDTLDANHLWLVSMETKKYDGNFYNVSVVTQEGKPPGQSQNPSKYDVFGLILNRYVKSCGTNSSYQHHQHVYKVKMLRQIRILSR